LILRLQFQFPRSGGEAGGHIIFIGTLAANFTCSRSSAKPIPLFLPLE
jgi:hypothetical protein